MFGIAWDKAVVLLILTIAVVGIVVALTRSTRRRRESRIVGHVTRDRHSDPDRGPH